MSFVLLFCGAFALVYFLKQWHKVFLCGIRLPGPWAVPLLGNAQMITKLTPEKLLYTINHNRETYRHSFRLWLGPQLWVFLHTPQETRDALNDTTLNKGDTLQYLNVLLGNGLLISGGRHWELHRKALGPAFHPNILNGFTETITQHVDMFVNILRDLEGKSLEVSEYLFPCIMDVIIDTSMGKNLQLQKDVKHEYTRAFHRVNELLFERMVNPWLFLDIIYHNLKRSKELDKCLATIQNLMDCVIKERQEYLKKQQEKSNQMETKGAPRKPKCLLDTLLTATIDQKPMTHNEIRDEVNTFVFAGVDTTAAAMAFVLYAMGKYPLEQHKLMEELTHNRLHTLDSSPTTSDLNELEYLDMFIKECLRLYTIVPMTARQTTQPTKIGERIYPTGVALWVNIYGLAHDSEVFKNPDEFRPLRFARDEYQRLPKFSYLPFSGGPHVCIGRKYALLIMKLMCIRILQNFEISLKDPHEELVLMSQMVLKSKTGINIIVKARNSSSCK